MALLVGSTVCLSVLPDGDNRPPHRMSSPGLTSEAQLRYILQWFGEFSELQREDFVPILAAARGFQTEQLAETLASLSCQDKPVSLFQCRIKLFNEWYPTWSEEEQDRLIKGVTEMDAEFGAKLEESLKNPTKVNGDMNGTNEAQSPVEVVQITENAEQEPDLSAEPEAPVVQDNIPLEIAAAS